jgi:hypothetical protein
MADRNGAVWTELSTKHLPAEAGSSQLTMAHYAMHLFQHVSTSSGPVIFSGHLLQSQITTSSTISPCQALEHLKSEVQWLVDRLTELQAPYDLPCEFSPVGLNLLFENFTPKKGITVERCQQLADQARERICRNLGWLIRCLVENAERTEVPDGWKLYLDRFLPNHPIRTIQELVDFVRHIREELSTCHLNESLDDGFRWVMRNLRIAIRVLIRDATRRPHFNDTPTCRTDAERQLERLEDCLSDYLASPRTKAAGPSRIDRRDPDHDQIVSAWRSGMHASKKECAIALKLEKWKGKEPHKRVVDVVNAEQKSVTRHQKGSDKK